MRRIAFLGDSLTSGVPGCSYVSSLSEQLPDHTVINLGRSNDTVIGLYNRLVHQRLDGPLDMAFLWIGVNDLPVKSGWLHRTLNTVAGQRRARDLEEFRAYYRSTLDFLCCVAVRVVAVSPSTRGEDAGNGWNHQLAGLSGVIEELASRHERVHFLDLRASFARQLAARRSSDYLLKSPIHVAMDALTLRSDEQVDAKAAERGLHLTLDGLHLNSAGATLVAEEFLRVIRELEKTDRWSLSG